MNFYYDEYNDMHDFDYATEGILHSIGNFLAKAINKLRQFANFILQKIANALSSGFLKSFKFPGKQKFLDFAKRRDQYVTSLTKLINDFGNAIKGKSGDELKPIVKKYKAALLENSIRWKETEAHFDKLARFASKTVEAANNGDEAKVKKYAEKLTKVEDAATDKLNKRIAGKTVGQFMKNDTELNRYGQVTVAKLKVGLDTLESRIKLCQAQAQERGMSIPSDVVSLYQKTVSEYRQILSDINTKCVSGTPKDTKITDTVINKDKRAVVVESMDLALDIGEIDYAFECFDRLIDGLYDDALESDMDFMNDDTSFDFYDDDDFDEVFDSI